MIKDLLATEQRLPIERWCRDRARAVAMPDGRTLCRVLGVLPMVVSLDDYSVAPHLALDGFWELWLSMRLARGLRPGWQCIDVGANCGYFTLLMALLTGAEVEAWEPMADLTALIDQTIRMNGLGKSVSIKECAAGASSKTDRIRRAPNDYGSASLITSYEPKGVTQRLVEVRRIDEATTLSRVDFIKIDAEGYEPQVWAGMEKILKRGEPKAMLMEWAPSRYDDPKRFFDQIRHDGFSVSVVDSSGGLQKPVGDITAIEGHHDLWLER